MTTILVVDDDEAIVEVLCIILEDEGYDVIVAHNGEEGLACLAKKRPAVVMCDLMMPIMSGQEMCRRMQANAKYKAIPFILMSAVSSAVNPTSCNYAAIVHKPFDLDNVLTTVDHLISSKR